MLSDMPRLYCRAIDPESAKDIAHLSALEKDPLASLASGRPTTQLSNKKQLSARLEIISNGLFGAFLVDKSTNQDVGLLHLNARMTPLARNLRQRDAVLGVLFLSDKVGKGLGSEAIAWMLERAFLDFNLNRVSLDYLSVNLAAEKCYRKLGFVEEGRLRQSWYYEGQLHDEVLMSMLRSEWEQLYRKV